MDRKLARFAAGLCLFACGSIAQTLQTFPGVYQIKNDPLFGTANYHLAKLNAAGLATILAKTDANGAIGLVMINGGKTGTADVASVGVGTCAFDGATTAGDYVQTSAAVAGDCRDSGANYPLTGQVIGRVLTTNGGAGSYNIVLFPPEIRASSSGSGGSSGNATTLVGIPLSATLPTNGQAWVYSANGNNLQPVAVPYWTKYTIPFGQLTGFSGPTATVTLLTRANRQKVCGVSEFVTSGFSGTSITGINVAVGDSNTTSNFYTPQPTNLLDNGATDANVMGSAVGSSNVTATFTSSGGNLSALSSGSIDIDVCLAQLP